MVGKVENLNENRGLTVRLNARCYCWRDRGAICDRWLTLDHV